MRFVAPALDDKTLCEGKRRPNPREQEPDEEPTWRVCDAAHGILGQLLLKRGEVDMNDPALGDPGGELTYAKRDRNILALRVIFVAKGYLTQRPPFQQRARWLRPPLWRRRCHRAPNHLFQPALSQRRFSRSRSPRLLKTRLSQAPGSRVEGLCGQLRHSAFWDSVQDSSSSAPGRRSAS